MVWCVVCSLGRRLQALGVRIWPRKGPVAQALRTEQLEERSEKDNCQPCALIDGGGDGGGVGCERHEDDAW